jgi:hypothetical protein
MAGCRFVQQGGHATAFEHNAQGAVDTDKLAPLLAAIVDRR